MKKLTTLLLALLMVVLVGCQSAAPDADDKDANDDGVITIEHLKGTTEIKGEVKKAVVFDFGVLDTIDALDIDVEVAIPTSSLPEYLNNYADATSAGGIKEPDFEGIFTFEPDVIFISGRQEEYYDRLNEIAPTIFVRNRPESFMNDFEQNTLNVARIFDKEDEAEDMLESIEKEIESAKKLVEASNEKALIILSNDGSISAHGQESRFGIIHDVLNVKISDENIESSTHGQRVNFEYISEVNPDILYVVDRAAVVGGDKDGAATLNNELVNGTKAAQNGKIIYLSPDYWYLSSGGLTSVSQMIKEAMVPFK
jgi:iron complex transport system substrate-binding protein